MHLLIIRNASWEDFDYLGAREALANAGVLFDGSAQTVGATLLNAETLPDGILIANHPPAAASKCIGDSLLSDKAWRGELKQVLMRYQRGGTTADKQRATDVLKWLETAEIRMKCLRHQQPKGARAEPYESFLFMALRALARAWGEGEPSDRARARTEVEREFSRDRLNQSEESQDLLRWWHQRLSPLCAVDLEFCVIAQLLETDPSEASAYALNMVHDRVYAFNTIAQGLGERLAGYKTPAPPVIAIEQFVEQLRDLSSASEPPGETEITRLVEQWRGTDGFHATLERVSQHLREAYNAPH